MARQPVKLLDDDELFMDDEQLSRLRPGHDVLPPDLFAMLTSADAEAKAAREPGSVPALVSLTLEVEQSTADRLHAFGPRWQEHAAEILRRGLARK